MRDHHGLSWQQYHLIATKLNALQFSFLACTSAQMQSRLVQKHDMQIEVAAVVHVARAVAFSGLMLLSKAGNATAHATCTPAARPVWLKLAFAQL